MKEYNWYSISSNEIPLLQGDLIDNLEIPIISKDFFLEKDKEIDDTNIASYDVIIISQSCDLSRFRDDDDVILCPRFDFYGSEFDSNSKWGSLRNDRIVGMFLLNKCDIEGHCFEYQIVNLKKVFSVPYKYLMDYVSSMENRVSLLPPYREYLAQSFAKQFMRIGLPINLPEKYPQRS